jgi:hypothetical protein
MILDMMPRSSEQIQTKPWQIWQQANSAIASNSGSRKHKIKSSMAGVSIDV